MSEEKLKPCPFRGGIACDGFDEQRKELHWYAVCVICHTRSGLYNTKERAAEAWNKRVKEETMSDFNELYVSTHMQGWKLSHLMEFIWIVQELDNRFRALYEFVDNFQNKQTQEKEDEYVKGHMNKWVKEKL